MVLLDKPCYPSDIAREFELGKANTSNHLTCLRGCGLVVGEPEGRAALRADHVDECC